MTLRSSAHCAETTTAHARVTHRIPGITRTRDLILRCTATRRHPSLHAQPICCVRPAPCLRHPSREAPYHRQTRRRALLSTVVSAPHRISQTGIHSPGTHHPTPRLRLVGDRTARYLAPSPAQHVLYTRPRRALFPRPSHLGRAASEIRVLRDGTRRGRASAR